MPRGLKTIEAMDAGPAQRAKHNKLIPELISQTSGRASHMRVADQTELDRLLLLGLIDVLEYSIGEKFWGDIYRAGLSPIRAQNYGRVMGSGSVAEITSKEAFSRMKVQKAMKWVRRSEGPTAASLLYCICSDEARLPEGKKLEEFKKAISSLSRFYEHWV